MTLFEIRKAKAQATVAESEETGPEADGLDA
jgi:hypothetical protein